MGRVTTRNVVEKIQEYLGQCSQKVICRYLDVTPVALSQNIERDFPEIMDNKVGHRIGSLLYVLECAKKDATLEAPILHRLLTLPAFKNKEGWKIDVVTGIHQEYPKEILVEIFLKAVGALRKPVDNRPVKGGLFNTIHAS